MEPINDRSCFTFCGRGILRITSTFSENLWNSFRSIINLNNLNKILYLEGKYQSKIFRFNVNL